MPCLVSIHRARYWYERTERRAETVVYLDTSALAKRYLNEAGSEEFEAYLTAKGVGMVSTLTVAEMRCLLARRRREGSIDAELEARIVAAFEEDLLAGVLVLRRIQDEDVWEAVRLVDNLREQALRTLDALHLASAQAAGVEELATSDRTMAAAAGALGMEVALF
jgi:predicted nucleic acid-binding protein